MREAADIAARRATEAIGVTLAAFAGSPIDRDNLAWYQGLLVGELRIMRCGPCGVWHHPPGPRCPRCWSTEVTAQATAGEGTVELATVLHVGPAVAGIDYEVGHPLVSVALDGIPGIRVTAPVVGAVPGTALGGRRVRHAVVERNGVPTLVFDLVPAGEGVAAPGGVPSVGDGDIEQGEV